MTDTLGNDIVESMAAMTRAWSLFTASLHEYQANCLSGNWKAAEDTREIIEDSLGAFLDHTAAANRRLEWEGEQHGK